MIILMSIKADLHTHSTFSFDGTATVREMAEKAISLGMEVLALTEHIDVNEYYCDEFRMHELIPLAAREMPSLIEEFSGKITLLYGVELAQAHRYKALTERLLGEYPFDYIIGSLHAVRGQADFYVLDYPRLDINALFAQYFDEILAMLEYGRLDTIGHLTYPLRYITGRCRIAVDLGIHRDKIAAVFTAAAKKDIAVEVNTGGLRATGYGKLDPHEEFLALYRECGGRLICFGSDAHRVKDLGAGIPEAVEAAKRAGFREGVYFVKRKPYFYDL